MKTVNLELAQKLKEAGFPQNTTWGFWKIIDAKEKFHIDEFLQANTTFVRTNDGLVLSKDYLSSKEMYSAPTAEEILKLLPAYVQFEKESLPFSFRIEKEIGGDFPDEYVIVYVRYSKTINSEKDYQERGRTTNESLADAAAKMWLYLKKKNLLHA